jgi:hypothetical protein
MISDLGTRVTRRTAKVSRPGGLSDLMADIHRGHHAAEVVTAIRGRETLHMEMEDADQPEMLAAFAQLHEQTVLRLAQSQANTTRAARGADSSTVGRFCVESVHDAADFAAWAVAEDSLVCWEDDDFLHYQDKATGCRVKRSQSRNSIIVPATRYTPARG